MSRRNKNILFTAVIAIITSIVVNLILITYFS